MMPHVVGQDRIGYKEPQVCLVFKDLGRRMVLQPNVLGCRRAMDFHPTMQEFA